jgi:hypothetical protein
MITRVVMGATHIEHDYFYFQTDRYIWRKWMLGSEQGKLYTFNDDTGIASDSGWELLGEVFKDG